MSNGRILFFTILVFSQVLTEQFLLL